MKNGFQTREDTPLLLFYYRIAYRQYLCLLRDMRSLRERFPDYPEVIDICEELFRLFETVSSLPIQPHHSEVIRFCFSPEDNEMQPYGTSGIPRKQLF